MKNYWLILAFVQFCVSCSINYAANGDISSATKVETKVSAKNIGQGISNKEQLEPKAPVSPTLSDLSGAWNEIIFGRDMGVARIQQNGKRLKFWNFENPPRFSKGRLDDSGIIYAKRWNLTAHLMDKGKKIVWSNGVVWIRQ